MRIISATVIAIAFPALASSQAKKATVGFPPTLPNGQAVHTASGEAILKAPATLKGEVVAIEGHPANFNVVC